jgi:ABC-type Fe3+-hydroxamate transport system substrate-binding protein
MPEYKDQMNRMVRMGDQPPRRIVSLVPSITELLFDLGLDQQLVGCTKFCIHPSPKTNGLKKIGGTKNIDIRSVMEMNPDLVIGNKEENTIGDITTLSSIATVWMSDVNTVTDAIDMIEQLGAITGTRSKAAAITSEIKIAFEAQATTEKIDVVYLIWNNPYMAAASDTFIDSMLDCAGFNNLLRNQSRYPEITIEELVQMQPKVLMLSSEPYPFKQKHAEAFNQWLPHTRTIVVDGTFFSWYGSRMTKAIGYFQSIHTSLSNHEIIQ